MNDLSIFAFGDCMIRIVEKDGEPYFLGNDVATALGYTNTRDAIAKHVDAEDKNTVAIRDGIGNPNKTFINESGLYALIFGSKLENAKKFKRWVTSEVLPQIRKTGAYTSVNAEAETKMLEIEARREVALCRADASRIKQVGNFLERVKSCVDGGYIASADFVNVFQAGLERSRMGKGLEKISHYMDEDARIITFVEKCCIHQEEAWVLVSELYAAYESFCGSMEHLTRNMFVRRLQLIEGMRIEYKQKKIEGYPQLVFFGLTLKGELVTTGDAE